MLFKEIINEKSNLLQPEFDKLFNNIINSQTHQGDLLLVNINGFYNPEVNEWSHLPKKLSPYVIGPHKEGHSNNLHYKFINNYRQNAIYYLTHEDYLKEHIYTIDKKEKIDKLLDSEYLSIQLEMLIYLKVWESDLFIKKLYQLTRLALGESYDWHFLISNGRDNSKATGTREKIHRILTRDRLENKYPQIYKALKEAYQTQIRNSIAHSNYSFQNRFLNLNNYIENDPAAQLKGISFDKWIYLFHDTMVIYNQIIRFFNKVDFYYADLALKNNSQIEVRINRKDPEVKTEYRLLQYRTEWKDWSWKDK